MQEEMNNKLKYENRNFCLNVALTTGRLKRTKSLFYLLFYVVVKLGISHSVQNID